MDAGWKRTTDEGFKDPAHHMWDGVVKASVADYNRRLENTPGYVTVDPTIVIAMLWVETNGPKGSEWHRRVMQFGNDGDLGFPDIHARQGLTKEVVSPEVLAIVDEAWKDGKKLDDPAVNIQGGIAYLFKKMAISDEKSKIVGWRTFDAAKIAKAYNGGGDPEYAEKLQYALDKLREESTSTQRAYEKWGQDHFSGGGAGGGGGAAW